MGSFNAKAPTFIIFFREGLWLHYIRDFTMVHYFEEPTVQQYGWACIKNLIGLPA
jgi:hypothetical protein